MSDAEHFFMAFILSVCEVSAVLCNCSPLVAKRIQGPPLPAADILHLATIMAMSALWSCNA